MFKVCLKVAATKLTAGLNVRARTSREVLGLNSWMDEMENDKMGLEVGLDGAGKADLKNSGNIVTVSAVFEQR